VFHKAGVKFAITGDRENCCGESVRKSGNETLFQKLASNNIAAFNESGINKIVVTSPHCYYTFKNEYPKLGGTFEVIHYTEFIAHLLKEGRLKPTKRVDAKVTYHDPCYLGRHSGVYDAPREVLKSIPGIELVEMPDHGPDSICCGGGGGRIWMETKKGERLSDLRLDQAAATGASILAAACPYCILNFEDSILTTASLGRIEVKDISELLAESL
jgi:Fe-S oxidoreductase